MRYNEEEKIMLVSQYYNGKPVSDICQQNSIPRSTIYSWIHSYRPIKTGNSHQTITPKGFDSLLRRCKKQEQIIAVLKSIPCIANATTQEKLTALELLHGQFNVHVLCEALDVPREPFTTTSSGTNGITVPMPSIGKNCGWQFRKSLRKADRHTGARKFVRCFTSVVIELAQHWYGSL